MNFTQTINFLYSRLPMFTKIGNTAFTKSLDNIIVLCEALGNPQETFKTIHVAGTNGKGSTSHSLAAILQKAGYKTGLYTSPHLKDFRERIRVDGKMMEKQAVIQFVAQHKDLIAEIKPSFFEVTVAMAFDYFKKVGVDIAVIEVGLGGRLDSTNIIQPELSIITNISLDHTQILGNSLAEIAFEKAGIIKHRTPVIIGERQLETDPVFIKKASEQNATLIFAEDEIHISKVSKKAATLQFDALSKNISLQNIQLDLTGSYQIKNIRAVLLAIAELRKISYKIADDDIRKALKSVKKTTGLQGRWQTLQKQPLVICDTGHNMAGISEVLENINQTKFTHLHIVIGMVKDKDVSAVLKLLPKTAKYYFCQAQLERALPVDELSLLAETFGLKGDKYSSVSDALKAAKAQANSDDLIFVGGSTFIVAEVV